MEDLRIILQSVFELLNLEFNVYGFSISFWQVFCFGIVGSILAFIIGGVINGGK